MNLRRTVLLTKSWPLPFAQWLVTGSPSIGVTVRPRPHRPRSSSVIGPVMLLTYPLASHSAPSRAAHKYGTWCRLCFLRWLFWGAVASAGSINTIKLRLGLAPHGR
jgi:hypothetical protein